jgi:SpoVK/Ycf46/Vps4 family AAA+-type ATPase
MEKEISVLDFCLPTQDEVTGLLDELISSLSPENVKLTPDEKSTLARAALGLTMQEAENAFCRAIVNLKGIDISAISIIHEEKNQVVKKTGVLEFVKTDLGIDDIGGLDNLKNWLLKRNNSWTEKAQAYNLPAPKGVLITGVPGCGKSLTAKAMSAIWGLPLLKLDMGKIFGGIVGSSEENMRKAIETAEAVSPSILWVDEIEKGFVGMKSGGDSGTSARVFGTFLTWLQEKTKPVFVIATANDISALPPELLRKGRFDEIFFVDLPTFKEREKIFNLHINKRLKKTSIAHEITASDEICREMAALSEGYVGAEIEQITISAMYEAFYADRGLKKEDLVKSIKETVPLSSTQREQILELRAWAQNRAVLATAVEDREQDTDNGGSDDDSGFARAQGGRIVDFDL